MISNLTKILQSTNGPLRIVVKEWREKRSLTASAQYYVWLPIISKFYGEDVDYIRKWMKHDIAWPIIERDNCDYSRQVRFMISNSGYDSLSRERKFKMLDMFDMTSMMNSKQHTDLRDELQIFWAKQGLELRYKNEK